MFELTFGMAVVFALILAALLLFLYEPVPLVVTAMGIMVVLMILEPWTGISPEQGVSGFSNSATITILAMMILSEGVRRTGLIEKLESAVRELTGDDSRKQLGATVGIVGPLSGVINNTAAVAMLLPMVSDLAHKTRTSPSKLLLPLSYASMMGGMLTLIGTSTNLLASNLSQRLLDHPISMFEFTHLGAIVFATGVVYLMTLGYALAPDHVRPRAAVETSGRAEYLTEISVAEDSPFVGCTLEEALEEVDFDGNITQLIREGGYEWEPPMSTTIEAGDIYTLRLTEEALEPLLELEGIQLVPEESSRADLESLGPEDRLAEIVITAGSDLVGETIDSADFQRDYPAAVLAIRRGGRTAHERLADYTFKPGDMLLIESDADTVERLADEPDVIVAGEMETQPFRASKLPLAVGTVVGVIALAALDVLPILVSALAGVVVMLVGRVLKPSEAFDAVSWDVIFLLAGVIPLGKALSETGGAEFLGQLIVSASQFLPTVGVLALFYLVTALMTNLISNQASVVLLIPVAVDAAQRLGADPFSFLLAVTFAASTAFMSPVGYQTNLFVYGPGGYEFRDYVRVGAPLQLLMAAVTTAGIAAFWGV
ncbi:MAG: SLC13 family permease [Bradymonadaceae bacterium]